MSTSVSSPSKLTDLQKHLHALYLVVAFKRLGGKAAAARLMKRATDVGSKQGLSQWKSCPGEWVISLERWSGVPRSKLRSDLYPPRDYREILKQCDHIRPVTRAELEVAAADAMARREASKDRKRLRVAPSLRSRQRSLQTVSRGAMLGAAREVARAQGD